MATCMFYVFSLYYHMKIMIVLDLGFIVYYNKIYEFRFIKSRVKDLCEL